jgi:hypothetical protein
MYEWDLSNTQRGILSPVRQNVSAVSTDALGTKKEIQTPEEADRPPDCIELKYVGTMAVV